MVSPELQRHINSELHCEAAILKEKRKASESINLLAGAPSPKLESGVSRAQSEGLRHLREPIVSFAGVRLVAPPNQCNALRISEIEFPFRHLGHAASQIRSFEVTRWTSGYIGSSASCTSIRDLVGYAVFIADLIHRGLVCLGKRRPHTVGIFFVWKSDAARLRVILDARRVNSKFVEPAHYQFAAASAWSSMKEGPTFERNMAQADDLLIRDRHQAPNLDSHSLGIGVYADNVAVVSQDPAVVVRTCEQIVLRMGSVGLICEGVSEPSDEQTELRQAAPLPPFAFANCRRFDDPVVIATDASGAGFVDHGGLGVTELERGPLAVELAISQGERWRYSASSAIAARGRSGLAVRARRGTTDFAAIPRDMIGDKRAWKAFFSGRFRRIEDVVTLEVDQVLLRARANGAAAGLSGLGDYLVDDPAPGGEVHGFKTGAAGQVGPTALQFEKVDALFFAGHNHDRADKLYAAVKHVLPKAGLGDHSKMAAALVAAKGCPRLGRGQARAPLAKPPVFAAIGLAERWGWRDVDAALCLSWGAYFHDLLKLAGAPLVPPVWVGGQALPAAGAWALLLNPEEQPLRSKARPFDESAALTPAMSAVIGQRLQQLKDRAGPEGRAWDLSSHEFGRQFRALFRALGRDSARPYQVRHGAASCDMAEGRRGLVDIQHRLRHATDQSSRRCGKHARCPAELAAAPTPILVHGQQVADRLAEVIAGKCQPALPASLQTATSPVPRRKRNGRQVRSLSLWSHSATPRTPRQPLLDGSPSAGTPPRSRTGGGSPADFSSPGGSSGAGGEVADAGVAARGGESLRDQLLSGAFAELSVVFIVNSLFYNLFLGNMQVEAQAALLAGPAGLSAGTPEETAGAAAGEVSTYLRFSPLSVFLNPVLGYCIDRYGFSPVVALMFSSGVCHATALWLGAFAPAVVAFSIFANSNFAYMFSYLAFEFGFNYYGLLAGVIQVRGYKAMSATLAMIASGDWPRYQQPAALCYDSAAAVDEYTQDGER
ncbi:unnamed protein product [Prorocentrum cordatum]|uniref:Uncharacterized protein n=1 Tax=Prorocentrum cordatum TaxID=2364126 RepID=A0ABN9TS49_9DINO|nr:unnamed protein product [Polarella glacialis]